MDSIIKQVTELLKAYPSFIRQIAVLKYELEHPSYISPDDILDAMSFTSGVNDSPSTGHISNKTMYIALNYREKAKTINEDLQEENLSLLNLIGRKSAQIRILFKPSAERLSAHYSAMLF